MVIAEGSGINKGAILVHPNGYARGNGGVGPLETTYGGVAPERYVAIELAREFVWQEGYELRDPGEEIPVFLDGGSFNALRFETNEERKERKKIKDVRQKQLQDATIPVTLFEEAQPAIEYIHPDHADWLISQGIGIAPHRRIIGTKTTPQIPHAAA